MADRRLRVFYALSLAVSVAVFVIILFLYPFGFQAVLIGGLKDVEADPAVLTLYASNRSIFCYEGMLKVRNSGVAGRAYKLLFSLEGSPEHFRLDLSGEPLLAVSPSGTWSAKLTLEPGATADLTVCLKAPSPKELRLVVYDEQFREATETSVGIQVVETDWWDNRFTRRLSLIFTVEREGLVLFEVLGSGEVYANGAYLGRVHALQGVDAGSLAVVYVKGAASYLLPFQVEAWESRADGVVEPKGLRSGPMGRFDRLAFAAYSSNGTRIDIYAGGKLTEKFEYGIRVTHKTIEVEGYMFELNEYGFEAPGLHVNLSGRIAFPYIARPETYSDWGSWKIAVAGPVRAVAVFNTSGLSGYLIEARLMVWGLKLNVTQLEVLPRTIRRGIVLEWIAPLISSKNVTVELVCGTTCERLPLKLEPWGVKLCENYWQPGDHWFGYFTLLFKWSELGSVKSVRSRLSSFPGG